MCLTQLVVYSLSSCCRLGASRVSARLGVISGIFWADLGLITKVALYPRFFLERSTEQIERRTLIVVSLLAVTGLDIVPISTVDLIGNKLLPTIEWWNNQISAWVTHLPPHPAHGFHVGGTMAVACALWLALVISFAR